MPCPTRPEDALDRVLALRRPVTLIVFGFVALGIPIQFLLGYTVLQVAITAVVGCLIGGVGIWARFSMIRWLRRVLAAERSAPDSPDRL